MTVRERTRKLKSIMEKPKTMPVKNVTTADLDLPASEPSRRVEMSEFKRC